MPSRFKSTLFLVLLSLALSTGALPAEQGTGIWKNMRRAGCAALLAGTVGYVGWGNGWLENPSREFEQRLLRANLNHPSHLKITYLAQEHYHPWMETWDSSKATAQGLRIVSSQSNIIRILRAEIDRGANPRVFDEGVTFLMGKALFQRLKNRIPSEKLSDVAYLKELETEFDSWTLAVFSQIQREFPNGFPKPNANGVITLSNSQASTLMVIGASLVLWATGELTTLEPATTQEAMDRAQETADQYRNSWLMLPHQRLTLRRNVSTDREILALHLIMESINVRPNNSSHVYLIYGFRHNFPEFEREWLTIETVSTLP